MANEFLASKLQEYLTVSEETTKEIFNQLALFIYNEESKNSDLYHLAKILPDDSLLQLISYFDGAVLRIPTKEEFKKCLLLSIAFFLHEVQGYSWQEVKRMVDLPDYKDVFSSVSLGKRLAKLNKQLKRKVESLLKNLNLNEDIREIVKKEAHDGKG